MGEHFDVFDKMAEKWASSVVARVEIERFTGGLLRSKYLANLDSLGQGPKRIICGRKVAYPVDDFVQWLRERSNKK